MNDVERAIDDAIEFMLGDRKHQFHFIEYTLITTLKTDHVFWKVWREWKEGLLVSCPRETLESYKS